MALTFTEKTVIVSDFYEYHADEYAELVAMYNLGFPLAFAVTYDGVEGLTEVGKTWITDAYEGLCEWLGVDRYGDYEDVGELLEIAYEQG